MADIVATYAVFAGTTVTTVLDDVSDPDLVATWLSDDVQPDVSVCHQCADSVVDPQVGHLLGFTVDGVSYERERIDGYMTGHWVATGGESDG